MDSIKSFKGYGKVDEAEERAFKQKSRRRMIIIIVSAIVFVTVIIAVVVGTLVHKNNNESSSKPSSQTTPAQSIKAVCSVTEYPKSCFTSLSSMESSNKADPEELFILSLQAAINELIKLSALPDKWSSKVNGVNKSVKAALSDCKGLFEDAIDELNSTITSMKVGPGENLLSTSKINNIKTWLSAAITDHETCLDGLIEMNSTLVDEVKTAMKDSTEFTSNSLAIVSKILTILGKFNIPIHRKLLGRADSEFPDWVNPRDRRLLQEVNPVPDLTVAQDGTGDFLTIREAISTLKLKNKTRTVIHIKAGNYTENVILDKGYWNIFMYGDGKDKTTISGRLNNVDGTPTFSSATFAVTGKGFIAKGIRFENTAGPEKHQAVALRSGSDMSVFYQCSFDAFQDTLYPHSHRQFYRDCDIIGTIDFIFGNAAVVFQSCNILPRQPLSNQFNTITAQGKKDPNSNTGISIQKCIIKPFGNVTARTYLGRPWKEYSTTVIMQSEIDAVVQPVGWLPWVANTEPPSTIFYGEYLNTGPGAALDKRVTWAGYKPTITPDEAGKYTVDTLIQGQEWLLETSVAFESSL